MKILRRVLNFTGVVLFCLSISLSAAAPAYAATTDNVGSWTASPSLVPVDQMTALYSGTATYNGYIYKLGGLAGFREFVYYAPLSPDGSVGTWQLTTSVPNRVFSAGTFINDGYIYNIGGRDGIGEYDDVNYAPLNSNGTIGSWITSGNNLPQAFGIGGVSVNNDFVYVTGGYSSSASYAMDTVYYAPLNPDGSVGAWITSGNNLPNGLNSNRSAVYNDYLYVVGGMDMSGMVDTVYYAPLNPDGSVGSWTLSPSSLPVGTALQSVVAYDGNLYSLGGATNNSVLDTVQYAPINADGSLGSWVASASSLPVELYGAAASLYQGYIYLTGGSNNSTGDSNTVYYASLAPASTTVGGVSPAPAAAAGTLPLSLPQAPSTGSGSFRTAPQYSAIFLSLASTFFVVAGLTLLFAYRPLGTYTERKH